MISEVSNSNPFFKLRGTEKDQEFSLIINIDTDTGINFQQDFTPNAAV